jgi:uncharacterized protein YchJ
MNTDTGEIHDLTEEQAKFVKSLVPIERDLTVKERFEKQILLYSPCGCGSGKKFKFCCHTPR